MKHLILATALVLATLAPVGGATAQIVNAPDARVVYGHHHLHVTDVAAHKRFWVDTLGGTVGPKKLGPFEVIRIHNAVILLQAVAPKGGTKGTTVGHLGLEVPDLRATLARLRAAGYPIVTRAELPPTMTITDDMLVTPALSVAFVMGPDETLVELVENKAAGAVGNHHLHFSAVAPNDVKAWYTKTFGAKAAKMGTIDVQEIPGTILMYTPTKDAPLTTKDWVLDHIGLEVKNLEQFCKDLEAAGTKLDRPYSKVLGLGVAFVTDPWGTVIELTEGLDQY